MSGGIGLVVTLILRLLQCAIQLPCHKALGWRSHFSFAKKEKGRKNSLNDFGQCGILPNYLTHTRVFPDLGHSSIKCSQ